MLTPVKRHGFTFWEAARCAKPPLIDLDELKEPPKEKPAPLAKPNQWAKPAPRPSAIAYPSGFLHPLRTEPPEKTPEALKAIHAACMEVWIVALADFYGEDRHTVTNSARIACVGIAIAQGFHPRLVANSLWKVRTWGNHAERRYKEMIDADPDFKAKATAAFERVKQGRAAA